MKLIDYCYCFITSATSILLFYCSFGISFQHLIHVLVSPVLMVEHVWQHLAVMCVFVLMDGKELNVKIRITVQLPFFQQLKF